MPHQYQRDSFTVNNNRGHPCTPSKFIMMRFHTARDDYGRKCDADWDKLAPGNTAYARVTSALETVRADTHALLQGLD